MGDDSGGKKGGEVVSRRRGKRYAPRLDCLEDPTGGSWRDEPFVYSGTGVKTYATKAEALAAANPYNRELTEYQRRVVDHVVVTGDGPTATARELGVSEAGVRQALRRPQVQKYLLEQTIANYGVNAVAGSRRVRRLIESGDEKVALAAAREARQALEGVLPKSEKPQIAVQVNVNRDGG